MKALSIFKVVWEEAKEHSHTVMAVGAVAGLIGAVILTYKKSPEIHRIMDEQRDKVEELQDRIDSQQITEEDGKKERKAITKETIKRVAPVAAPIALCTAATAGLSIGSAVVSSAKLSHVRDLLSISEVYNRDILEKVKEELGEDKAREIQDKINEDHLKAAADGKTSSEFEAMVFQAKGGDVLYYDAMCGRLFKSDENTIEKAVNKVNKDLTSGKQTFMSLNEIYRELELPSIPIASDVGCGMYSKVQTFDLHLSGAIKLDNGYSAVVFDFWNRPSREDRGY